ncbi:hypothetical protein [Methylorubrum extorquens]
MPDMGFRSLLVLAKIGYDLRDEFADTFDDDFEGAFGPLLEALEGTGMALRLADDEYKWLSDEAFFEACSDATLEDPSTRTKTSTGARCWSLAS